MPFSGTGSTLSSASDAFFSTRATGDIIVYNGNNFRDSAQTAGNNFNNIPLVGTVALANKGGSETISTNTTATGTVTLDLTNGNIFNVTLTGNTTFAFTGATSGRACSFSLYKRQNTTGGFSVTWPASVKWSGGAPTLTTTASSIDILVFETLNGGTTWFGSLVGADFN